MRKGGWSDGLSSFLYTLILVAIEIKVRKNCQGEFNLLDDHLAVLAIENKR